MAGRDPLFPNAGIVARREYRDRVRSPLFVASTVILMGLAMLVALAPIAIRYLDRQTVTRIAVVSSEAALAASAVSSVDSLLNRPPTGSGDTGWQKPFAIEATDDPARAEADLRRGALGGIMIMDRLPSGQIDVTFRTNGTPDAVRSQLIGFAAIAVSIYDWTASRMIDSGRAFQAPAYRVDGINAATEGGVALNAQQSASRSFPCAAPSRRVTRALDGSMSASPGTLRSVTPTTDRYFTNRPRVSITWLAITPAAGAPAAVVATLAAAMAALV